MWIRTPDGSIVDRDGKVIYFSCERFVRDICEGNCCFICGAAPGTKPFNNEHVLPDWLLSRYGLHSKTVTLSNGAPYLYGRFTVPCCAECNSLMGTKVEDRISKAMDAGPEALIAFIAEGGLLEFYVWMGLIFLKAHLKDREFRFNLDRRAPDGQISDFHDWAELHHLHCIVRCFYTGATIEREVVGSFFAFAVRQEMHTDLFDFMDLSDDQAMLIRLGDWGFVAVFNDAGGAATGFQPLHERISGAVSELQLREILAEAAFLNIHLKERPKFQSDIDIRRETYRIVAKRSELFELKELDLTVRGELLEHVLRHALSNIRIPNATRDEVLAAVRAGSFTLLFDENGNFFERSIVKSED